MTKHDKIVRLLGRTDDIAKIATRVGTSKGYVYRIRLIIRDPARRESLLEYQRECGKKRHASTVYKEDNRKYKRRRYHSDPEFRARHLAAVKRYRERVGR